MASLDHYLSGLRSQIPSLTPEQVKRSLDADAAVSLIDVREESEIAHGHIPGASWIPLGVLQLRIGEVVRDRGRPVVIYCAHSTRAPLAARSLYELGYRAVSYLSGGFSEWKRAGYPCSVSLSDT